MTERKPPGVSWETWIDRQIRLGIEQGAFDDLPGAGKPVRDLDQPRDEMWWVRAKLRRENIEWLPPTLQVRKEFDAALEQIAVAASETEVREIVAAINARVRWVNSRVTAGPPSTVSPLDAEAEVAAWRSTPAGEAAAAAADVAASATAEPATAVAGGGDRNDPGQEGAGEARRGRPASWPAGLARLRRLGRRARRRPPN